MNSLPCRISATVLFGAAYYPEYQPQLDLQRDLRLMAAAGFTVIRVGESVWSTWEPRDGEFDLDWLQPVLDAAQAHDISVILGTPTYAVPPWLQKKHPDIAAQYATGVRRPWGGRQEVDYSHPEFRSYAERVSGRSSLATSTIPRSSATRSTTSRGSSCFTTGAVSTGSSTGCGRSMATSRRSTGSGGSPIGRTGSTASRSCGRLTATGSRSMTSPGEGTRPS